MFFFKNKTFITGFASGAIFALLAGWLIQSGNLDLSIPKAEASELAMGPEEAPVVIHEFADFHCPFCRKGAQTMNRIMETYEGKVRWVFHHYPLSSTPGKGSFLTHEASECAAEQGRFWAFHDLFFSTASPISDWSDFAQKLDLDVKQFESCLQEGRTQEKILQDRKKGQSRGVSGTPAFFINEYRMEGAYPYEFVSQVVESLLSTGKAPLPLDTHGKAIEFSDLEGRPSQGSEDAQITLVEFGDYHCPFCARVQPTLKSLMEKYQGRIRHVFRHFPLGIHPDAIQAHSASECAHRQGKFWSYHDAMFQDLSRTRTVEGLTQIASETGLDEKAFKECLANEEVLRQIKTDLEAASTYGVQATPTVFVNGEKVQGAQPVEVFTSIIEDKLKAE